MRPAGKVVAVQCGDLLVEVRPKGKVGLDRMPFLLAPPIPASAPKHSRGPEADLFAALAESLLSQGCAERFRLNAHYLRTLRLAELVLGNISPAASRTEHTVTSFVVTRHHRSACAPTW